MANSNGGIVGVDNPVVINTQAQQITTFNSSGTFAAQPLTTNAWVLVLAGGGGGTIGGGSGGGAGGHLEVPSHPLPLSPVPITVGGSGAGAPKNATFNPPAGPYPRNISGSNGSDSVLGAAAPLTAIGGGGGRIGVSGTPENGNSGGSGGGAYRGGTGGTGTPGQGFAGGGTPAGTGSGGGGGAGGAAADQTSPTESGSNGGNGLASSISGSSVTRGGGGGGGANVGPFYTVEGPSTEGLGGPGGGGNAGKAAPDAPDPGYPNLPRWTAGGVNLGGGGGGQSSYAGVAQYDAAPGGSGTVIINEPAVTQTVASGVWDMNALYDNVKAGTWTNA